MENIYILSVIILYFQVLTEDYCVMENKYQTTMKQVNFSRCLIRLLATFEIT